jgi:hypothetical protein
MCPFGGLRLANERVVSLGISYLRGGVMRGYIIRFKQRSPKNQRDRYFSGRDRDRFP